jgi:hypothetical protein
MFICGRLHHFAIGGCIAALAFVYGVAASVAQPKDQPPAASQQQQTAPEQPKASQPGALPAAKESDSAQITNAPEVAKDDQPDTPVYKSACGDTKNHSQADLCEQQRMSAAAERAATYAWWQLIVGAIGLGAVALSLVFAGIGAFAARDAAIAGTNAARIARNAERPYFIPYEPNLKNWDWSILKSDEFAVMEVHLGIENVGKGVGFFIGYGIGHEFFGGEAPSGSEDILTHRSVGKVPVSSSGIFNAGAAYDVFQIPAKTRLEMLDYKTTLYVYGYFRYSDLFDIKRRTGFMYQYIPDQKSPDVGVLAIVQHPQWYDREERPDESV